MKYVDEFRTPETVQLLAQKIKTAATREWSIMEVCGGQTHTIMKYGLGQLLPPSITLLHGPGCPVCVTDEQRIDKAIALAAQPGVILCTFGDMIRVPGSQSSLMEAKARGGDVRIVYSPLDALALAEREPGREIVFFAVGFETTAPTTAAAAREAKRRGICNFSLLVSHVLVPPALEAILMSSDNQVDGFLAAGHVCTVMGLTAYEPISAKYEVPIIATGFEPVDILQGILMCIQQLEQGLAKVENQYTRAVTAHGNTAAQRLVSEVFQADDQRWRGLGCLPQSGLRLKDKYREHDADARFDQSAGSAGHSISPHKCLAGDVLRGAIRPSDCPYFKGECTPDHPLGAPMVSSEGACAAYYSYQ